MNYDEIEIGQTVRVVSRKGWIARVEEKFKSTADGTEYVYLADDEGHSGFNYPSQLETV